MTSYYKDPADLLSELGITEPEEVDIEAIAQHCAAMVLYDTLTGCEARLLGVGNEAIITVKRDVSVGRRRFSAAHELGHWMRDRGKAATYSCTEKDLKTEWSNNNPEHRANLYAADLLLPQFMFSPLTKNRPMTFETVIELAERFSTSLTATAIRLVRYGTFPAMLFCFEGRKRKWSIRGDDIYLRALSEPGKDTYAYELIHGSATETRSGEVSADGWIDHVQASRYSVHEDSRKIGSNLVLSLLWWKNERGFLELQKSH